MVIQTFMKNFLLSAANRIVNGLKDISPWHVLWISIVLSEFFTFFFSTILSHLLWGYVPREVLIVGLGDALLVDIFIVTIILLFMSHISTLKQELKGRHETEKHLRILAHYDSLTNLPNRTFFRTLLKKALSYAERYKISMAVMFIDLDHFKRINDTLGHVAGDQLLREVTDRLLKTIRSFDYVTRLDENQVSDVVSRLGGDEFILLLHNISHEQDAAKVAQRILKDISVPFKISDAELFITASIGIALYPSDGTDGEELIKNADIAMYHAKAAMKNNYQYYSNSMNARALESLTLENMLHKALERHEFLLYYQPKKSMSEDKINGMEALLRWRCADTDMISPSQFIPLAEENGLIFPIGEWALRTACLQNKAWQEAGYDPVVMSVNLSCRQFDQKNLVELVTSALNDAGLDPQYLELEITESALMKNPEEAISTLRELKKLGIKISIDDFGTGYSSLNYLSRIPLDSLKIDRSFVMNLETSNHNATIVEAIISMGHKLKLKVIAEGVETEQQMTYLREHGCDDIQGFLLSKPLPVDEISRLLTRKVVSLSLSGQDP
jgi:diguanylate cyclase (GGDEF)-like protein